MRERGERERGERGREREGVRERRRLADGLRALSLSHGRSAVFCALAEKTQKEDPGQNSV